MALPQRPQLWMRRTRSFWFGLAGLIFLTALWLGAISHDRQLRYVAPTNLHRAWNIGIERSNLTIRSTSTLSGYYSPAGFRSWQEEPSHGSMEWWPEKILLWNDRIDTSYGGTIEIHQLQLPIWPLIPLWLTAWLWWMTRKDRREAAYFSGVNTPGDHSAP